MNVLPSFLRKDTDMPDPSPARIEDDPEAHQFFMQIRALRQQNAEQIETISALDRAYKHEKEKNSYLLAALAEAERKRDRYQGLYTRLLSSIHHIEAAIELAREEARKTEPFGAPEEGHRPVPLSTEDQTDLERVIGALKTEDFKENPDGK